MTTSEPFQVEAGESRLAGERRSGDGPTVVLLHAGVTDRRSWHQVASELGDVATVVSYDQRGFGETPPSKGPFSHVADLLAVLDHLGDGPAWLVGSSMGGGVALDAALTAPERLAGLVLIAPAVSGAPEPELDSDTAHFDDLLGQAIGSGDMEEVNRLETWLWLDGPGQPEGRVSGPVRELTKVMSALILAKGVPEDAGASGVEAWNRLGEVSLPVTVACGELDVPFLVERSRQLAERLPSARYRLLDGVAHLPQLERPSAVSELIAWALRSG